MASRVWVGNRLLFPADGKCCGSKLEDLVRSRRTCQPGWYGRRQRTFTWTLQSVYFSLAHTLALQICFQHYIGWEGTVPVVTSLAQQRLQIGGICGGEAAMCFSCKLSPAENSRTQRVKGEKERRSKFMATNTIYKHTHTYTPH